MRDQRVGRWYKTLREDVTASETWRDPQVFRDAAGDGWHMLIAARGLGHGPNDDGVLAHARSHDLLARPFTADPDLFAAPLVQQRDASWALVGFRSTEPRDDLNFHILDPVTVTLDEHGTLV